MIPRGYIAEWSDFAPWKTNEQIEQDLIISRSLVELFSDDFINQQLAFRGGTALHKLFFESQPRYSEDIDLVQILPGPFGPVIDRIREHLSFIGNPRRIQKNRNNTLIFKFKSEIKPVQTLRLKVETNCREHFSVFDFDHKPFQVKSSWFSGDCLITTYQIEELLGTKLRALYQRKKGRDLYDLNKFLNSEIPVSRDKIIQVYHKCMNNEETGIPSKNVYLENLENKMKDPEFLSDTMALLRINEPFDPQEGFITLKEELIDRM